ncbi:hypothetical protein VTO42DRAFT_6481 [Malbranchea cinnamomea]
MTVPIIQTEIAVPHGRGLMVGIEYTCLIAGYMRSCWVDYGFNFMLPENMSWQGSFIIQICRSSILQAMYFFLFKTPRWLAKNGFMQESLSTVADLHSKGDTEAEHVQHVFLEIQEAVIYETTLGEVQLDGVAMAVLLGIVCAFTEADLGVRVKANGQHASVMPYNIVYGFTWGPMPWVLPDEIFPPSRPQQRPASHWVLQFPHRQGFARRLRQRSRVLLPSSSRDCACFLPHWCTFKLRRDCEPYVGGDCGGIWRQGLCR